MTTSVLINVRLPQELRSRFADFCAQQGVSVSEAVRRMIEHAIAIKTVKPDDNIWDVIARGGVIKPTPSDFGAGTRSRSSCVLPAIFTASTESCVIAKLLEVSGISMKIIEFLSSDSRTRRGLIFLY